MQWGGASPTNIVINRAVIFYYVPYFRQMDLFALIRSVDRLYAQKQNFAVSLCVHTHNFVLIDLFRLA